MAEREGQTSAMERARGRYEETESTSSRALERLVSGEAFAELLVLTVQNVAGLTKLSFDAADLMIRSMRLAGRADVVRLGRQLARNERKLERVLQEIELLRDEVAAASGSSPAAAGNGAQATGSKAKSA
jgi:hypothetical protein